MKREIALVGDESAIEKGLSPLVLHSTQEGYRIEKPQQIPHPFIQIGGTNHPKLLISRHNIGFKQGYDDRLEQATQKLGLNLTNTREHLDGVNFIGNINRDQALSLNEALGNFTIPIVYFKELLTNLRLGIDGKPIYDQDGKPIDQKILQSTYEDITKQTDPYRAQWFNDKFEEISGQLHHIYTAFVDGKLQEVNEPSEDYSDENRGISLDAWLKDPHILPRKDIESGKLYFWCPFDSSVAWFFANSIRVVLSCDTFPAITDSGLGVRATRLK